MGHLLWLVGFGNWFAAPLFESGSVVALRWQFCHLCMLGVLGVPSLIHGLRGTLRCQVSRGLAGCRLAVRWLPPTRHAGKHNAARMHAKRRAGERHAA